MSATYDDKAIAGADLKTVVQSVASKIKKVAADAAETYEPKMTPITDTEIGQLT
jgi:hypothetical protein